MPTSLVPVDHDPEFDHDLQAVDYDPFAAERFANPFVKNAIGSLATLPQRAIQNSQFALDTGTYDPSAPLEAATLPMGTGAIAGVPVRAGEAVLGAGPIRAYHGSPHDFDAFDLSKIGTGEGAQAYGHGLYFAENPKVAEEYRNTLADWKINGKAPDSNDPSHIAAVTLKAHDGNAGNAIADLTTTATQGPAAERGTATQAIEMIQKGHKLPEATGGKMYEVNINADPANFLDWDRPLSEQSPKVQEALQQYGVPPNVTGQEARNYVFRKTRNDALAAGKRLSGGEQSPATSAALSEAGIPGIKYLDQGSRGAGEGSRNYVVFNDKLIDIVRKYAAAGIALPPAIAAEYSRRFQPVDHDPFAEASQ